ncbi:unnamed protein product [Caenorhabditis auriculariae]|uniref:UNC93-like protein MFSD11 n=1 Tax=Caenorhabditis auriculariae TaxID=2777116 RepID=A0A8S1H634_9PELO|nr:unnamed protein product [Caenorhabditis auriculariae]
MRKDFAVIVQLGLAFAFIFSAFNSQGLIEISVLRGISKAAPESGITEKSGYYSLSIIYFVFTISNLFVPPIVQALGSKWSQVTGALCYLVFMLAFLRLNALLLYAGSALLGFGAALLWTGNGMFLVQFSRNGKLARNCGVMWAMIQSSLIIGAIFLIFVLRTGDLNSVYQLIYTAFAVISSVGILVLACLPSYPPVYELEEVTSGSQENLIEAAENREDDVFIRRQTSSLLNDFREEKRSDYFFTADMLVLSITFMYTGIEMTFYTGVFTACISATTALSGYSDLIIPYSALAIGSGQIIGGMLTGTITKTHSISKSQFVIFGMIAHIVSFFLCFISIPFDSPLHKSNSMTYIEPSLAVILLTGFLLGLADAFWQTQVYAVIGLVYGDHSASAFALFKFFQSFAACVSFYYGSLLFLHWQLLILVVTCFCASLAFVQIDLKTRSIVNNE